MPPELGLTVVISPIHMVSGPKNSLSMFSEIFKRPVELEQPVLVSVKVKETEPSLIEVTNPLIGCTVAIIVLSLTQIPYIAFVVNWTVCPTHIVLLSIATAGRGFTTIVTVSDVPDKE